jgi:ABC-type transport system substrate-binding protein
VLGRENLRHCRDESTAEAGGAALPFSAALVYEWWREAQMRKRRLVWLALLVSGAGALGSAFTGSGASEPAAKPRQGGTFRIALWVNPGGIASIDPALATGFEERLLRPTCAQLLAFPGLKPEAATEFPEVSRDRRTYTFTIRPSLRFNTGERVTARSFARAFERYLDPRMRVRGAEDYAGRFVGGREFYERRAQRIAGVRASGNTLVLRLTRPYLSMLEDLATRTFCAVPAALPVNPEGASAPLAGAGPYYIARYVPGREVVLLRNRRYGGPRKSYVDRFHIDLANTHATAVERAAAGGADFTAVFPDLRRQLAARFGINRSRFFVPRGDVLNVVMLVLNTNRPLFRGNARLRRAVSFAVDRQAILAAHGPYLGFATDQFLSSAVPGVRDVRTYPFKGDLAKARALARGSTRSGRAVIYARNDPFIVAQAELVRRRLSTIGITGEIRSFGQAEALRRLQTPGEPFDIAFVGWGGTNPTPTLLNCLFHARYIPPASGGCNWSRFDSPYYNRQLDRAERLRPDRAYRLYAKLDVELARVAAPAVALYHQNRAILISARAGCLSFKRILWDLAGVCLKR